MERGIVVLIMVVSLISARQACAQPETSASARPKIGLVLGGGGARGAAHVGVLKVLEEHYIPVDMVVGTSMGSIVGGLYAAGMSPAEMMEIFETTDWDDMFSDRPSEALLSFRDKDNLKRLAAFELGVKHGKIVFPSGVVAGQKLDFLLKKLTLHTVGVPDFDHLRIPYRAVAADAATGEPYIFDRGYLADAIRASMSVPGAFPPVRLNNKVYIDGGLILNDPVEVAKHMGADIIIVVDVGSDLTPAEQLNSLVDVTNQMVSILFKQNVDKSLALLTPRDTLIRPDMPGISPKDFGRTPDAARRGEEAARAAVDALKRYSVSFAEYTAFLKKQRREPPQPLFIDAIRVNKPARVHRRRVEKRITTKAGEYLDVDKLYHDLERIYAIGDFETVTFDIEKEGSKNTLVFNTQEKNWGPDYVRFGLTAMADTKAPATLGLTIDYRKTQLNDYGAEWKTVLFTGRDLALGTELYQPLDPEELFFVTPRVGVGREFRNIYQDTSRIAEYRTEKTEAGVDAGANLASCLQWRVGVKGAQVDAKSTLSSASVPAYDNTADIAFTSTLDFDQLDNHSFPTRGIKAKAEYCDAAEDVGSDVEYRTLTLTVGKATTLANKHTVAIGGDAGLTLDGTVPYYALYRVGGFMSLTGYAPDQLRGQNKAGGKLVYYYKLIGAEGLLKNMYAGATFEAANVWPDRRDISMSDLIVGGNVFLGMDTILGPVYIAYGRAENMNEGTFSLYLGRIF